MIVLEDYIRSSVDVISIDHIPTYSRHSTLTKRLINKILLDHPEYYALINALAAYPAQKWAFAVRKKIGIDPYSIRDSIMSQDGSFFGMRSEKWLQSQENKLKLSDEMMEFMAKVISSSRSDAIKAVHGYRCEDVSEYIMKTYYINDLLDLCSKNIGSFTKLKEKIEKEISLLEDDIRFVAYDPDWLMKLKPLLKGSSNDRGDVDYQKAIAKLDACIKCLDSYYLKDLKMKEVAGLYSDGKKETEICRITGKSRTYVRNAVAESAKAISYIIWGYFSV